MYKGLQPFADAAPISIFTIAKEPKEVKAYLFCKNTFLYGLTYWDGILYDIGKVLYHTERQAVVFAPYTSIKEGMGVIAHERYKRNIVIVNRTGDFIIASKKVTANSYQLHGYFF